MKKILVLLFMAVFTVGFSQSKNERNDFSGSEALNLKKTNQYYGKKFLMDLLGHDTNLVYLQVANLTAPLGQRNEIATFVYKCNVKKKAGLVLGLWDRFITPESTTYGGYIFKHFNWNEAWEFFSKIDRHLKKWQYYLETNKEANIYFDYDDVSIFISKVRDGGGIKLRVFYDGFDSEWSIGAYNRTTKRFEKSFD